LDVALCNDALDVLEAAVFGESAAKLAAAGVPAEAVNTSPVEWETAATIAPSSGQVPPQVVYPSSYTPQISAKTGSISVAGFTIGILNLGVFLGVLLEEIWF
jgi:hypothetical protein